MKNIRFELAGRIDNLDSTPFLTSRSREYKSGNTIFHRNDYHTTILIPEYAFKKFFKGQAGFPKFKKRNRQSVGIYFPKNNKAFHRKRL